MGGEERLRADRGHHREGADQPENQDVYQHGYASVDASTLGSIARAAGRA